MYRAEAEGTIDFTALPKGPINYPNGWKIINNNACGPEKQYCVTSVADFCTNGMAGCYQFLAPHDTMYHFSFSAPVWQPAQASNQDIAEFAKVTVFKSKDRAFAARVREFYQYMAAYTTNSTIDIIKGHFTCSFNIYMKTGHILWLENLMEHTLTAGTPEYQVEFSAWMFKPIDDNQENQNCIKSGI